MIFIKFCFCIFILFSFSIQQLIFQSYYNVIMTFGNPNFNNLTVKDFLKSFFVFVKIRSMQLSFKFLKQVRFFIKFLDQNCFVVFESKVSNQNLKSLNLQLKQFCKMSKPTGLMLLINDQVNISYFEMAVYII